MLPVMGKMVLRVCGEALLMLGFGMSLLAVGDPVTAGHLIFAGAVMVAAGLALR